MHKSNDLLHRFLFENQNIRGEFIQINKTFLTVLEQHPYPPPVKQLLGEALCVAGLLGAIIKFDGKLTVQFRGNGNLKLLFAECDNKFNLRGLAKWQGDLTYQQLMSAFQDGILMIMLDSNEQQNRYQGIVSWRGSSLVESIEGYFQDSEQLKTKLWLAVNDISAAGLLLQVVPSNDNSFENEQTDWDRVIANTQLLTPEMMLTTEYQTLLRQLYPNDEIRIFKEIDVRFHCPCNRQRGERAILILGREEAEAELIARNVLVVTCDFCNHEYIFERADIEKLFSDSNKPTSSSLH